MKTTISAIHHVSLLVDDTARALEFYQGVLGLKLSADRPAMGFSGAWLDLGGNQQIHLLQLPDWQLREDVSEELDRWMYLFREGEELDVDDPPVILQTEEMRQAMQVLQHFSENEREYLLYQSRLEAEQVEQTWKAEITRVREEAAQAKHQADLATQRAEQERREKEQAQRREEQERKEKERLLELLKQAGIDPAQQS